MDQSPLLRRCINVVMSMSRCRASDLCILCRFKNQEERAERHEQRQRQDPEPAKEAPSESSLAQPSPTRRIPPKSLEDSAATARQRTTTPDGQSHYAFFSKHPKPFHATSTCPPFLFPLTPATPLSPNLCISQCSLASSSNYAPFPCYPCGTSSCSPLSRHTTSSILPMAWSFPTLSHRLSIFC